MKKKIVVLDGYTLNSGDLSWDALEALGECIVYERTPPSLLIDRAKDAQILLTNKTELSAEHIAMLPELKYIGVLATGYNVVDVSAAHRHGVVVTNIPAYSTSSVAQMVFAHLLGITQRTAHYADAVRSGAWSNSVDFTFRNTPLIELAGLTMGIVGLGSIGQAVAQIAHSFGMRVCAYTSKTNEQLPSYITSLPLDELFGECDVISLHVPLTDGTFHLVNADRLALMKPTAILINTGRGFLIDETALANALNEERIYAVGLDVLSTEPPTADNPLLTAKNCFITPHISWATRAARSRLMEIAVQNLTAFLQGKAINEVGGR